MKGRRREIRLGVAAQFSGQLAPPDPDGVPGRLAARWLFLALLADEAPNVLRELYQNAVPLAGAKERFYLNWTPSRDGPDRDGTNPVPSAQGLTWADLCDAVRSAGGGFGDIVEEMDTRRFDAVACLRDAILAWGGRYRLADEWILDIATRSVLDWALIPREETEDPAWRPELSLETLRTPPILASPDRDGCLFPGETEAQYVARLMAGRRWTWIHGPGPWLPAFESEAEYLRHVEAYTKAVRVALRKAGHKPAPKKRTPRNAKDPGGTTDATAHFRWVIRLHVLDKPVRELCGEVGLPAASDQSGPRFVRAEYRRMCAWLGLTARQGFGPER